MISQIKKDLLSEIISVAELSYKESNLNLELVKPPKPEYGDYSLPCFDLARRLQRPVNEIAKELAVALAKIPIISSSKSVGPYINIIIDPSLLAGKLFPVIDETYGHQVINTEKAVMIEFANFNTHKEFHIGHLRNVVYGASLVKLIKASGQRVIPVSYINDFGIHVAKVLWLMKNKPEMSIPDNKEDKGYLLGQCYVTGVALIKDDTEAQAEVLNLMQNIESRNGSDFQLWDKTRQWSIDYFNDIFRQLKIDFDYRFYESEVIDQGKKMVGDLLRAGKLTKSQGAVIADLEAEDLGILVLERQDGTALYPVADLALAVKKFELEDLAASYYVVDNRQSLYFKQLFSVLRLMGYEAPMKHLSYDFVTLPSGMMSSRSGNTVTFETALGQIAEKVTQETVARHPDWDQERLKDTVAIISQGTLRFEMLKVNSDKIIVFDIDEALRFDGYTAVYLLYTVARINSLIKKADDISSYEPCHYGHENERVLIVALEKFGEIVLKSAETNQPAELAKYLFDLAKNFNDFYQLCPILSEESDIKTARLVLSTKTRQVLKNGLELLGIEIIEQM